MGLDYRVLGPVEVWAGTERLDIGGPRQRRLLGALVVAGGLPVAPERLVDIVWLGAPPDQARNTLRTYVARLRRALEVDGDAPLTSGPSGYGLPREPGSTDSERFESLLGVARSLGSDPIAALASLEEALALWRGPAFGEFAEEDWCAGEAVRLDELRLGAMEDRFDAMLACGLYSEVAGDVERFVGDHPLRERARGQLMLAMYREGRQVEALRLFQDYRRYLDDEVGVEPSADLRALEQRIVARDPSLEEMAPAGRALRGYQLGRQIGQGAFGTIYQASQPSVGREVAIKVVRAELANDPEFIRRFDAEAQIVARLEHPHIVPLFDYWREPGGAYLVMRYLRGGSAEQLVRDRAPVPMSKAIQVVEEVGGALAAAHARGVVHRDVKPANILFDEDGNSYLADFGIATGVGSETGSASASSPVYASPEQVIGAESAPSADLYALGAVLYELLTGLAPFAPDTPLPDMLEQKLHDRVPSLRAARPDLPADIDAVIQRATAPSVEDRFADIGELLIAFRAATSDPDVGRSRSPISLAAANPYKGLAAFQEADAGDFFGRTELVGRLLEQVQRSRFVAVVGPSGSGKSSLVRAGLMPRLRAGGNYITSIIPGSRPMGELETALLRVAADPLPTLLEQMTADRHGLGRAVQRCLPDDDSELVVIIDQFEELFTLTEPAARDEFLEAIAAAVTDDRSRLRVVVTLRADFYDRPLGHRAVSELVQANTLAVTPLAAEELERAITGPAARTGVTVEPALTAELVADATSSPSSLPLLQYVLTESFEHREGDQLTLAGYHQLGGITGAVARRADELFGRTDDAGRDDIRMLFTRLIAFGEGSEDTRRRVRRSELAAISGDVIAAYGDARLLSFDHDPVSREPTVEVAHEALIREWPRLRGWLDDDREGLRVLRHLTGAAEAWDEAERDEAEVYRGGRLETAEEWAAGHPGELNPTEQAFLDASCGVRDAESELEQRRVRRLRLLVVSLGVIAVVAIVAGLVAFQQKRVADDNAAEAEQRALENRTSRLVRESSFALVESDPDLAILLALAAHDVSSEISDTPQPGVVAALHEAVQGSRLDHIIEGGFAEIAVSPDGRTVALDHLAEKNRLGIYDIETGELLAERTFDEHVGGLAYSPDGSLLTVSFCCPPDSEARLSEDLPAMVLLDPTSPTLETVHELNGGVHSWKPSWSADGSRVLVNGFAGVRVWRVGTPEVEQTISDTDRFSSAVFVPGSSMIAVASSGSLDVIDLDTAAMVASHRVPFELQGLQVSPTGDRVALIDPVRNTVDVIDLGSGESLDSVVFQSAQDVRFSPDGASLSIAGNTDSVQVVYLESGDVFELRGHGSGSHRQAYTPEGRLLVAMLDGGTRVWNLAPVGPGDLGNLTLGGRPVGGQPLSSSEILVTVETGPGEAEIELHDITTGTSRTVAEFWFRSFRWPAFSPDGALVAGFSLGEQIPTVIDVQTGRSVATLGPCDTPRVIDGNNEWILVDAWCLDESPPAASGSQTGFLDLATGELIASADTDAVFQAVLGPPGSVGADVVAYTTFDHVVFRRASTLEVLYEWPVPEDVSPLSLEFSPDGSALGVSSQARQGVLFDVEAILAGESGDDVVTVFREMHAAGTARVIPVGDSLVTTGVNEIRQWDAATGTLLVDVSTDFEQFAHLFALPDDKTLFYADANEVLRRFVTDVDDLVELARSRLQRRFTDVECDRYFQPGECPA